VGKNNVDKTGTTKKVGRTDSYHTHSQWTCGKVFPTLSPILKKLLTWFSTVGDKLMRFVSKRGKEAFAGLLLI
jgi:hypothetical protein